MSEPSFNNIQFWARCKVLADNAIIPSSAAATNNGSVVLHADAVIDDAYPIGGNDPMYFLIGEYWLPLLAGAGMYANWLCQPYEEIHKMWTFVQRHVLGCMLPDFTFPELKSIIQRIKRPTYAYTGW